MVKIEPKNLSEQKEAVNQLWVQSHALAEWARALYNQVEFAESEFGGDAEPLVDTDEAVSTRRAFQNVKQVFEDSIMAKRAPRKAATKKRASKTARRRKK